MKFCPRCGSDLIEGANFCSYCGYNLSIVLEEDELPPYTPEDELVIQPKEVRTKNNRETGVPPIYHDNSETLTQISESDLEETRAKEIVPSPVTEPEPGNKPFADTIQTPGKEPIRERKPENSYQPDNSYSQRQTPFLQRVINILLKPKTEWLVIENEKPDRMKLITRYAMLLAIIPALCSFISYGFILADYTLSYAIIIAILRFVVSLGIIYLATYISEYLAPSFEAGKDFDRSFQLVCFAYTPGWVFFILALIPHFDFLAIFLGFGYMTYLLYTGIPVIKKTPEDKSLGYSILMVIASFVSYLVIYKVLESILL